MQVYRYRAVSVEGEILEGYHEAESDEDVLAMLKNNKYYPISIEEDNKINIKPNTFVKNISRKDIAVFCRQFYTMLDGGVSIINCLDILVNQTENRTLQIAIFSVSKDVQRGMTLSESMKKNHRIFPPLLINMVEVGETSGSLDIIMQRMAIHYEKENRIENKIKSAFVYPVILSVISIVVVIFLLTVVMPTFIGMFESSHTILPLSTRMLLTMSNWLIVYWHLFTIVVLAIILGLKFLIRNPKGRLFYDSLKMKIPIFKKININIVTSRFTRIMAIMISSGIPLLQAMEIVSEILGNKAVSQRLDIAREDIRKGVSMSEAIENINVFPPMMNSMLKVGEESGAVDNILNKTADFYEDEVETSIQRMVTLLEPMLIVLMGIVIGFIVISMAMPMFDLVNTVEM